jgi:WD40 repeat protein
VRLVVLLAGLSAVTWQWRRADAALGREADQRQRTEAALAHSALALAEAALRSGDAPGVLAALESVPASRRDPTWTYLQGEADTSRVLAFEGLESGDVLAVAPVPSRPSCFVVAGRRGRLAIYELGPEGRASLRQDWPAGFAAPVANEALSIAVSADGERVAVGRGGPGGLVIHRLADGAVEAEWPAQRSGRLEFSPDGTLLLQVEAERRALVMWDVALRQEVWRWTDAYQTARFVGDGAEVANFSWGTGLRLVRASDGEMVRGLPGSYLDHHGAARRGDVLVAGNPLGFIRGFSLADGRQIFESQPHGSPIVRVEFLPGDERFLTASVLPDGRQALQVWAAASGRLVQTLLGGSGELRDLAVHPRTAEVVVLGQPCRVWSAAGDPPVQVLRGRNVHPSAVFWGGPDTLFGPDPGAFGSALLQLPGWPTEDGAMIGEGGPVARPRLVWRPSTDDHGQPSVSLDGRRAAIGRYNSPREIEIVEWEAEPGRVRRVGSVTPFAPISYVRLSPHGDRLAVVEHSYERMRIVGVPDGLPMVELDLSGVMRISDLAWLDDGRRLAGLVTRQARRAAPGSVEQVALWDVTTGRQLAAVSHAGVMSVLVASPDGRQLAEAGADRNVRVRDAATLEVVREFRAHNAPLTTLAWHPSGSVLATAGEDLSIRLWHLPDARRLEELVGPLSPPSSVSFSADGRGLAVASRDRSAWIWRPRALRPGLGSESPRTRR